LTFTVPYGQSKIKYLLGVIGRHLRYYMIGVYNKYLLGDHKVP
jgi:hypothetical protein